MKTPHVVRYKPFKVILRHLPIHDIQRRFQRRPHLITRMVWKGAARGYVYRELEGGSTIAEDRGDTLEWDITVKEGEIQA